MGPLLLASPLSYPFHCRPWLERFNVLIPSVVYSFLRIIEDHWCPQFAALRQKEVNLVISLLRERFNVSLSYQYSLLIYRPISFFFLNNAMYTEI